MAATRTTLLTIDPTSVIKLQGRLTKAANGIIKAAEQAMEEYGAVLVTALQQEAPQDTGKLQASIKYEISGRGTKKVQLRVFIGNKERPPVIVRSILFGSKPHQIPKTPGRGPRPGPVTFYWPKVGRVVTFKKVQHPGTKPNPFHTRAWERTEAQRLYMQRKVGGIVIEEIKED